MASAHVAAAIPTVLALEWHARGDPRWDDFVKEHAIIEGGQITLPDDPGLAVTLDQDTVAELIAPVEPVIEE